MKLSDFANMTAEEIKAQHDAAIEAAKAEPVETLAARAVQFLIDAKKRDELLSTQGVAITAQSGQIDGLKDAVSSKQAELSLAEESIKGLRAEVVELRQQAADMHAAFTAKVQQQGEINAELADRCHRLKALAMAGRQAINASASVLNDALAKFQIADADGA